MARIPRPVRNIIISVVVLVVLSVAGGTAYTLFMDQNRLPRPSSLLQFRRNILPPSLQRFRQKPPKASLLSQ